MDLKQRKQPNAYGSRPVGMLLCVTFLLLMMPTAQAWVAMPPPDEPEPFAASRPQVDDFDGDILDPSCTLTYEKVPTDPVEEVFGRTGTLEPDSPLACPCLLVVALALIPVVVSLTALYLSLKDDPNHTYHQTLECGAGIELWGEGSGGLMRTVTIHDDQGRELGACEYSGVRIARDFGSTSCKPEANAPAAVKYKRSWYDDNVYEWAEVCFQPRMTIRNSPTYDPLENISPPIERRFSSFHPNGKCVDVEVEFVSAEAGELVDGLMRAIGADELV
jgi:hypothetical protein